MTRSQRAPGLIAALVVAAAAASGAQVLPVHVWELQEITFQAAGTYDNPYVDVRLWIDLEGPGFAKRIYGFWDGDDRYKVRFVATRAGSWRWTSGSDPVDPGLAGMEGLLEAVGWTEAEMTANPNRRGFIRATANGRALEYADGTPFFLLGDTWLAASTWRLPFKGTRAAADDVPGPGISFEEAVAYRKAQGFNSVSFIAAFPNWDSDHRGATYADRNGVFVRNAWEKFGHWTPTGELTAKDMHDEDGRRPFGLLPEGEGAADFDRLVPGYFQSLDWKMRHLSGQGFVPMLETVRRDNAPAWKEHFDFDESYARYVQYLVARYGAFNMIFSGIHLDWIPEQYSLTADEFNAALTHHHRVFGPLPFGQPYTTLIDASTYRAFGHGEECPWLTMHSVGNSPRNHGTYALLEEIFRLNPPYPSANLEPYYTGWNHSLNEPGGERPPVDSERDNYFARAQMYGSFLSGGLAGHVHGTAAYDITTTGEPAGFRPYFWDALRYASAGSMRHLGAFALSEGRRYQELSLASDDLRPRKAPGSLEDGLDGWGFMMRTPEAHLALLYFEQGAVRATLSGLEPGKTYRWTWFDPRRGRWLAVADLDTDPEGRLLMPLFPGGLETAATDWAARVSLR